MGESLIQLYETLTSSAQQELYDFALFLITKQNSTRNEEKSASEKFFEVANRVHGNSIGQTWTREELYDR